MTNTDTRDVQSTVEQIKRLERVGCEIVRVGVPDMDAAEAIGSIKPQISIPLVVEYSISLVWLPPVMRTLPVGQSH